MEKKFALLALCVGNSPVTGEFPHKGQWRGALMFPLICARVNGWVNNREAGDLRRHRAHYDVTVMWGIPMISTSEFFALGVDKLRLWFWYILVKIGLSIDLAPDGTNLIHEPVMTCCLLIWPLWTNNQAKFKPKYIDKKHLKMTSAKWQPLWSGLNAKTFLIANYRITAYIEYAGAIRQEYCHVPDQQFREGRTRVSFVNTPGGVILHKISSFM